MIEVAPTLGPPGTKKIIVASHERSGTHFLMNTLADNFGYVSAPWFDIDDDSVPNPYAAGNIQDYLSAAADLPMLNLLKTHFEAAFFKDIIDWVLKHFSIIYIYRKPLPTMESLRRHVLDLPWNAGPRSTEESALYGFLKPRGALLRYQSQQYQTLFERHQAHCFGWRHLSSRIIKVKYEDLDERFDATVDALGQQLGLVPLHASAVRPSPLDRTITPEGEKQHAA
jgi:hypothetical protein